MSAEQARLPRWVVEGPEKDEKRRDQWWYIIREGQPYSEGQLGEPWGNFTSKKWAEQTAQRANALEAENTRLKANLETARRHERESENELRHYTHRNVELLDQLAQAQARVALAERKLAGWLVAACKNCDLTIAQIEPGIWTHQFGPMVGQVRCNTIHGAESDKATPDERYHKRVASALPSPTAKPEAADEQ